MKCLIDGYNLIFECGLQGRQTSAQSLTSARESLLQTIAQWFAESDHGNVTVVFDAQRQMLLGQHEQETFGRIVVLYSINYQDADEMIEHLIAKHAAPKQLTVVSSDHRIHKAALRRKATPIDSGDWYDQLLSGEFSQSSRQELELNPSADTTSDSLLSEDELANFWDDVEHETHSEDTDWPNSP